MGKLLGINAPSLLDLTRMATLMQMVILTWWTDVVRYIDDYANENR